MRVIFKNLVSWPRHYQMPGLQLCYLYPLRPAGPNASRRLRGIRRFAVHTSACRMRFTAVASNLTPPAALLSNPKGSAGSWAACTTRATVSAASASASDVPTLVHFMTRGCVSTPLKTPTWRRRAPAWTCPASHPPSDAPLWRREGATRM